MHYYKNKKITVFGMGTSGVECAKKLTALGARVTISEKKQKLECNPHTVEELKSLGVNFEFGGHSLFAISGADLIVVSPGIHLDLSVLEEARRHDILIISEIELAYRFLQRPIIAVTGTNGKTTTSTLIYEMLKAANKKVCLAGNIGTPLVSIDDRNLDFIVAEISSYQLEGIVSFRPWVSVLLNITPDHMERHKSIADYCRVKSRIFLNQGKTDFIIYNADDRYLNDMVKDSPARKIHFTLRDIFFDPGEIKLKGRHNYENIMAAAYAALISGTGKEKVNQVIREFPGVPHRIELINKINEISFYNDSKATNPDSTIKALEALSVASPKPNIILILGGFDKGLDISLMIEKVKKYVKEVVLIGAAAMRFHQELIRAGFNRIHFAESLEEAVVKAYKLASPCDHVLLSPACSSFDMFSNFEERGDAFRNITLNLQT